MAFSLHRGSTPILISTPHAGIEVPDAISARFTDAGRAVGDTDWHLEKLYDFAPPLGLSLLCSQFSRYVVDLNRSPDNASLYPGQNVTELCPTTSFDMEPLYLSGDEPSEDEIKERVERYWRPYHDALSAEIERIKADHGYCILFEGHSIRHEVTRFFDGKLRDLNWGTNHGASADPKLIDFIYDSTKNHAPNLTQVTNGRFKGGYITRQYGDPAAQIHAVQLEMAQRVYMDESPPYLWDVERAKATKLMLKSLFQDLISLKL